MKALDFFRKLIDRSEELDEDSFKAEWQKFKERSGNNSTH